MAITLTLDTLERATITDNINTGPRIIRTGIIKGINTLALSADQVFARCTTAPGLPAFKSNYPAAPYTDCVMTQLAFEPFQSQPGKTRVLLQYERLGPASIIVTFVLSRQTAMTDEVTELHPETFQPIIVTHVGKVQVKDPKTGYPTMTNEVISRVAPIRYRRPIQQLVAKGYYKDGPPPADMINALGTVNDATWRGLPKGYWFYAGQSDVTQDKGGSYTITLTLETNLRRDWAQYAALKEEHGRYFPPDPADVTALRARPYAYDVFQKNNITKIGLYPLANFGGIFGFGGIA